MDQQTKKRALAKLKEFETSTVAELLESWKGYCWGGKKIESPFVYARAAYSIKDLSELVYSPGVQPDQQFRPEVHAAAEIIVMDFVSRNFITTKERETAAIEKLASTIISKFDVELSLFGLAHCLNLLEYKSEPLQKSALYGLDLLGVVNAISTYLRHCRIEWSKFKREFDAEEQMIDTSRNYDIPPAILEKYRAFRARHPDTSNDWFSVNYKKYKDERKRQQGT